jgi:hypothetical protein
LASRQEYVKGDVGLGIQVDNRSKLDLMQYGWAE